MDVMEYLHAAGTAWTCQKQTEHPVHDTYIDVGDNNATPVQNEVITCSKSYYVHAAYDRSCYIWKVLEDDVTDKPHIDFLVESGEVVKRLRRPNRQDTLWIKSKDIIRKIQHPIATWKEGRLCRVSDDDIEFIETYNCN